MASELRVTADTAGALLLPEGVGLRAGAAELLSGADLRVTKGQRWAIVGPNGAGKSTLLRAIAGETDAQSDGMVTLHPGAQMGFLRQTAVAGSTRPVLEEASSMSRVAAAAGKAREAEAALEAAEGDEAHKLVKAAGVYADALADLEALGGEEAGEALAARVLKGLGFSDADLARGCDTFSGGWQMRIGLAKVLLQEPEVLLLDEPSNHLDAAAKTWLGDYLASYPYSLMLVSHDAPLMEAACTHVAEVSSGRLSSYAGGWKAFQQLRAQKMVNDRSELEKLDKEAAELEAFIRRFGAKATMAAQANSRKLRLAKLDVRRQELRAVVASDRQAAIASEAAEAASEGGEAALALVGSGRMAVKLHKPPRSTREQLVVSKAAVGHNGGPSATLDDAVLGDIDFKLERHMRVAMLGPNGAGKSTLLHALGGRPGKLHGGHIEEGDGVEVGLFTQDLAQDLPMDTCAAEYVLSCRPVGALTYQDARNACGGLGLAGDSAERPLHQLSGGEKARAAMAAYVVTPHTTCLFDEPTNHLDPPAIEALAQGLYDHSEAGGCVVVSSHNETFMRALQPTHVLRVGDGKATLTRGPPEEHEWPSAANKGMTKRTDPPKSQKAKAAVKEPPAPSASADETCKLDFKEAKKLRNRLKTVTSKMERLEVKIAGFDEEMAALGADMGTIGEISAKQEAAKAELEELEMEWLELEDMLT